MGEEELISLSKSELRTQKFRELIIEESLQMVDNHTMTIMPPIEQAGSTESRKLEIIYSYSSIELDDVEPLASALLSGEHGRSDQPLPDFLALKFIQANLVPGEIGGYCLKLQANDQYIKRLDTNQFATSQAGRWKCPIQTTLSGNLDRRERTEIDSRPARLSFMPLVPYQISVLMNPVS